MIYSVKARCIPAAMAELYRKLTDGTIQKQKPDGREIVDSMNRARISELRLVQWSEKCFCSPPLQHERQTVLDHYFTDMEIEPVDDYVQFVGEPFMVFLARHTSQDT